MMSIDYTSSSCELYNPTKASLKCIHNSTVHDEAVTMCFITPRATLTPLSCSPNFPFAEYLDIRTLTHELIVN